MQNAWGHGGYNLASIAYACIGMICGCDKAKQGINNRTIDCSFGRWADVLQTPEVSPLLRGKAPSRAPLLLRAMPVAPPVN